MERTWEEKKTKLLTQWIDDLRETAKIDINEGFDHIGRHGYDALPLRHAERQSLAPRQEDNVQAFSSPFETTGALNGVIEKRSTQEGMNGSRRLRGRIKDAVTV